MMCGNGEGLSMLQILFPLLLNWTNLIHLTIMILTKVNNFNYYKTVFCCVVIFILFSYYLLAYGLHK